MDWEVSVMLLQRQQLPGRSALMPGLVRLGLARPLVRKESGWTDGFWLSVRLQVSGSRRRSSALPPEPVPLVSTYRSPLLVAMVSALGAGRPCLQFFIMSEILRLLFLVEMSEWKRKRFIFILTFNLLPLQ